MKTAYVIQVRFICISVHDTLEHGDGGRRRKASKTWLLGGSNSSRDVRSFEHFAS